MKYSILLAKIPTEIEEIVDFFFLEIKKGRGLNLITNLQPMRIIRLLLLCVNIIVCVIILTTS